MTNNELPPKPQRDVIREVDWLAVAPWLLVLRAVGATIGWPLVIGVIGVATLGWSVNTVYFERFIDPLQFARLDSAKWLTTIARVSGRITDQSWLYYLGWPALRHVAWMFLGVVIAQHAARSITGIRPLGVIASFWRSLRLIPRVLGSVALLAIPMAFCAAGLWLCGLVAKAAMSETFATGVSSIAGVLLGLPLALCFALIVLASPLLVAAVVVDDADAFDAVSRTTAYVFQKPGSLAACVLVGWVGFVVASVVVSWLQGTATTVTAGYIGAPSHLLHWVLMGFFPAYFYCAGVATYLVMRRQVDGQPMDEISHAGGAA